MDISSYIASGILEAYVYGEVSPQEAREVACLSKIYPEIQAELESLQQGLEGLAMSYSQEPPAGLRDKLMATIDQLEVPSLSEEEEAIAAPVPTPVTEADETVVRPLFSRWYMQVAAGLLALIAGWWIGTTMLKPEMKTLEGQVAELEQSRIELEEQIAENQQQLAVLSTPNSRVIELAAQPKANGATMRVLWQEESCEAYFLSTTLPAPAEGKDYQLWALVDGQPVDLGVIPRSEDGIAKMKATCKADAFAVTLEPKGGSVNPTFEDLLVLGEV